MGQINYLERHAGNEAIVKSLEDKTLLIVEDTEYNYMYFKYALQKTMVNILWAKQGKEAISLFKNTYPKIDCVLMDIKLPDMSGFEVTRQMKGIDPNVPIIAQTAYALTNDKQRCLDNGCDDYLAKPIGKDQLLKAIYRYL